MTTKASVADKPAATGTLARSGGMCALYKQAVAVTILAAVMAGSSGCAAPAGTSTPGLGASATPPASSAASEKPLEGRWVTGPIPIADIKAFLVKKGVAPRDVARWVKDTGSPKQFAFELNFEDNYFTHSEETPQMAMQVGESGTFTYTGDRLVLSVDGMGTGDSYTLGVTMAEEELTLRYIDSTENGTAEDKENHRRFLLAFYCAKAFVRRR